jgi:hypothetical protein
MSARQRLTGPIAISIDAGASGLLRFRFVRAFAASLSVGLACIYIGALAASAPQILGNPEGGGAFEGVLILVIVALILAFSGSLLISIISAVAAAIHRRLTGLLLLVLSLALFLICAFGALAGMSENLGWSPRRVGEAVNPAWVEWSMVATALAAAPIAFEAIGWAWWQLRVPRGQFFAARGWRAPMGHIYSSARQSLGMPPYISNFGRERLLLTIIYFFIAVLNLGLLAVLAAPFSLFSASTGKDANLTYGVVAAIGFLSLLALNAVGLGALLTRIASARVTRLYQKTRDWDARPPIVFLRAFDQDAQRLRPLSADPLAKFPAGCGESKTLDELLLDHASVYGPVIAIGDPRDPTPPLGAARVFVPGAGNEWQHVVTSLLGASNAVVMCPSTSEGVKWELDLISDAIGRLKVIFLANPLLTPEQTHALFQRLAPGGAQPPLQRGQIPIAAFMDPERRWTVLSTKMPACVQTYTVALNYALQALLGMNAAPLPKQRRARLRSPRPAAAQ